MSSPEYPSDDLESISLMLARSPDGRPAEMVAMAPLPAGHARPAGRQGAPERPPNGREKCVHFWTHLAHLGRLMMAPLLLLLSEGDLSSGAI